MINDDANGLGANLKSNGTTFVTGVQCDVLLNLINRAIQT